MPRYFYDIHDGSSLPDVEGVELPGLESAREAALRLADTVLRERAGAPGQQGEWKLDVRDEGGVIVFTLTFFAPEAEVPAQRRASS